jgi:putative addiction module component (TIGR02574 family)
MSNYDSVLSAACELATQDRQRLIDALWETVPVEAESDFSPEWLAEIERRVEAYRSGKEATIPWSQVRDEALARVV